MAYGFTCKHCGHEESPHIHTSLLDKEEASNCKRGYRLSLMKCKGFEYAKKDYPDLVAAYRADPDLQIGLPEEVENRIADLDDADGTSEYMMRACEAQGRARAAFGQLVHYGYLERLDKDIAKLDEAIETAHTSVDKKLAEQAKEKYMRDAQNAGCLYIG